MASKPTDWQIVEALALKFRVHESKIFEWLMEMNMQAVEKKILEEFKL